MKSLRCKSFLLVFFLLIGMVSASAQNSNRTAVYEYCEIVPISTLHPGLQKIGVFIDYGQERRHLQDRRLRDEESGRPVLYNSMIEAMNAMAESGWEFVQAYVIINGDSSEARWILKRSK